MSSRQDDAVRSLLQPSESLQCTLDAEIAVEGPTSLPADRADPTDTPFRRCLIAVVTHRNHSQDIEVGSLFICNTHVTSCVSRINDALPITEHLVLAVAQTGPVNPPAADSDSGAPWSAWLLSVNRGPQDTRPLTFIVRNTQKLRSLTAECRRLKEILAISHPVSTDFAWIDAYVLDPSSRCIDLRLRNQPLHARLSTAIAGHPGDDVSDISIVRRDWIEQAAAKVASSGDVEHLRIRLGTFNVNGKAPSQDLYPWLRSSESGSQPKTGWMSSLKPSPFWISDRLHQELWEINSPTGTADSQSFEDPDMLVLGFQELDLSTEALLYTTSTLKEEEWLTAILAGLGEKRILYEKLTSRQLVGMLLIVIVKKALTPCFTDIRSCDAGSGFMGFMGNKGATAIRLEFTPQMSESSDPHSTVYRSTVLTFVNAHLAASDQMVDRRNYDFHELSGRMVFSPDDLGESYVPTSFAGDTYSIYQSDVLFWMGGEVSYHKLRTGPYMFRLDLNYRLDLPDEDTRKLLFSHLSGIDSIQILLLCDQLRAAIRSNNAFSGFREHPITHFPTYRLAPGVSRDRLGYDIKRKPAWTDRVLYIAPPDVNMTQVAYRSYPEITMSDHQPVSADFDISLALIDQSQYENTVLALHRELAGFEDSERQPKLKINPMLVDFGIIKYKQIVHQGVVIQNEGNIPCVFRFVGTGANPESVAPSWLRIDPMVGLLRPRETTTILLSAYVDNESAAKLNLAPPTLECTLILHTALGKDDFITVSGYYHHTCFANTLERLTRLAGPIRTLESPEKLVPIGQAINAPTEIMRLINWMMAHVSATDVLFEYPAEERLCHVVRECLDTGDKFPPEGPDGDHRAFVAAFTTTLVAFLDSLTEPVVPPRLHAQCLEAREKDEAFEALGAFPHESINVWVSLTACLHYIAQHSVSGNGSDPTGQNMAHRLASVFAPILLRDDPTGMYPRASPVGKRDFLLRFID